MSTLSGFVRRHEAKFFWAAALYVAGVSVAVVADLFLVLVLKVKSISMATWIATQAHPTLIAFGVLVSVGIAYLLWDYRWLLCVNFLLCGHLFIHW